MERSAGLGDPHVRALFDLVVQDLADDTRRLLFADALTERGDPWGEFIVLQVQAALEPPLADNAPPRARGMGKLREAELRRAHGASWIPPGVRPFPLRFERGFLISCACAEATDPADPRWRTVQHLVHETTRGSPLEGPALLDVVSIRSAADLALELLAAGPPRPKLELLGTRASPAAVREAWPRLRTFPALRTVDLGPMQLDDPTLAMLTAGHGQVARLRFFGGGLQPTQLVSLSDHLPGLVLEVTLDEAGKTWLQIHRGVLEAHSAFESRWEEDERLVVGYLRSTRLRVIDLVIRGRRRTVRL
jgi:uncharacterized protein (TIGR02996 family)